MKLNNKIENKSVNNDFFIINKVKENNTKTEGGTCSGGCDNESCGPTCYTDGCGDD